MRRTRLVLLALVAALLSGCGVLGRGVYDTPLPGGADVGSNPVTLTADFTDVLDLVPQSSVRVDNVAVGRVSKIALNDGGRSARVTLVVNRRTALPAGTQARLQQTSLLGEKYVALVRPDEPVAGAALKSGDRIGLAETSQAAEVEQVLGALSMVLNGGGIGQFQEISRELQKVSDGRPEEIKAFLKQVGSFVTVLDDRKESITAAIDGLARLSANLDADRGKIASALDGLEPGMRVIADQRQQLVSMLRSLDRLSSVTVKTLDASQDDIVADLKALEPIITQLAKAGSDLPDALEILLTYPFPDSVLGAIKGDYMNLFVETNFRALPAGCSAMGCAWDQVTDPNYPTSGLAGRKGKAQKLVPSLLPPTSSPMPGLPSPTVPVPTKSVPASPSASPSPTGTPTAGSGPTPTSSVSSSPSPSTDPTDGGE